MKHSLFASASLAALLVAPQAWAASVNIVIDKGIQFPSGTVSDINPSCGLGLSGGTLALSFGTAACTVAQGSTLLAETTRAMAEESVLGSLIATQGTSLTTLGGLITAEAAARAAAVTSIDATLSSQAGSIATNASSIAAEVSRAESAESLLSIGLSGEVTRAEAAESAKLNTANPGFTGTETGPSLVSDVTMSTAEAAGSLFHEPLTSMFADWPTSNQFGAICDGASRQLSTVSSVVIDGQTFTTAGWTLAQWQTLFPSAASLSEELDNAALQTGLDQAGKSSGVFNLHPQVGNTYPVCLISTGLQVHPTRTTPNAGVSESNQVGDIPRIMLIGTNVTLKNTGAPYVIQAIKGTSPNGHSPTDLVIDGFSIDGGNIAGELGIDLQNTAHVTLRNLVMWDFDTGTAVNSYGSGGHWYTHNYIVAHIAMFFQNCGDTKINNNAIYSISQDGTTGFAGASALAEGVHFSWSSGDIEIRDNTFNCNPSTCGTLTAGVNLSALDAQTQSSQYFVRHVLVSGNEFAGFDAAVEGSRDPSYRNLSIVNVSDNHLLEKGGSPVSNNEGVLINISGVDQLTTHDNIIGNHVDGTTDGTAAIQVSDCNQYNSNGDQFTNMSYAAYKLTDCSDVTIAHPMLNDVGTNSVTTPMISINAGTYNTCARTNIVDPEVYQSHGNESQTLVAEGSGCDYTEVGGDSMMLSAPSGYPITPLIASGAHSAFKVRVQPITPPAANDFLNGLGGNGAFTYAVGLLASNNLADLPNPAAARTFLQLGNAAVKTATGSTANVASVNGAAGSWTIGDVPVSADANGTIKDGFTPGALASENAVTSAQMPAASGSAQGAYTLPANSNTCTATATATPASLGDWSPTYSSVKCNYVKIPLSSGSLVFIQESFTFATNAFTTAAGNLQIGLPTTSANNGLSTSLQLTSPFPQFTWASSATQLSVVVGANNNYATVSGQKTGNGGTNQQVSSSGSIGILPSQTYSIGFSGSYLSQ